MSDLVADRRPDDGQPGDRRSPGRRAAAVGVAVAVAVVVNVAVHALGRAAGADYAFTRDGRTVTVDAVTVAGFSAVPLLVGLLVLAVAAPRLPVLYRVARVVAPVLAVATIGLMTVPAGFSTPSMLALAACHLTLVPISLLAISALEGRR